MGFAIANLPQWSLHNNWSARKREGELSYTYVGVRLYSLVYQFILFYALSRAALELANATYVCLILSYEKRDGLTYVFACLRTAEEQHNICMYMTPMHTYIFREGIQKSPLCEFLASANIFIKLYRNTCHFCLLSTAMLALVPLKPRFNVKWRRWSLEQSEKCYQNPVLSAIKSKPVYVSASIK